MFTILCAKGFAKFCVRRYSTTYARDYAALHGDIYTVSSVGSSAATSAPMNTLYATPLLFVPSGIISNAEVSAESVSKTLSESPAEIADGNYIEAITMIPPETAAPPTVSKNFSCVTAASVLPTVAPSAVSTAISRSVLSAAVPSTQRAPVVGAPATSDMETAVEPAGTHLTIRPVSNSFVNAFHENAAMAPL